MSKQPDRPVSLTEALERMAAEASENAVVALGQDVPEDPVPVKALLSALKGEGGQKPKGEVTEESKLAYLEHVAATGEVERAAIVAGLHPMTMRTHRKSDPNFAAAFDLAKRLYRESVAAEVRRRGKVGVLEPVVQQGRIVTYVRKYSDRLLELEAKKVDPGYRDKASVDLSVSGGVLAVGNPSASVAEWMAKHKALAQDAEFEVVDEKTEQ